MRLVVGVLSVALVTALLAVPPGFGASVRPKLIWTVLDRQQERALQAALDGLLGSGPNDRQRQIPLKDGLIFIAYHTLEDGSQCYYYEHLRTEERRVYLPSFHAISGGQKGARMQRRYTVKEIGEFIELLRSAATTKPPPSGLTRQLSLR